MIDRKEQLIREICTAFESEFNSNQLQKMREILVVVLNPYDVHIGCNELSTDVKSEDAKAYQMYFVSKKIEGLSEKTLKTYKYTIDEFLSFCKKSLNDITTNDVRYYLAFTQAETKCTNSYNDTRRRYLNSFFSWLETENLIVRNPVKAIKKIKYEKKVRLPFEPAEVEKMRDAVEDYSETTNFNESKKKLLKKRNIAILEVLLSTGMRVGELATLKISNLNFAEGTVKVLGKGNKERICYLNDVSKMRLNDYLQERKYESEWVFTNIAQVNRQSEKLHISIRSIEAMVRKLGQIANVNDVHPHRFRRTSATWCIRRGMDIEKVRQMLGHEKIETTLLYAITSEDDLKNSHKKYMN